jgi:hypothetical protein
MVKKACLMLSIGLLAAGLVSGCGARTDNSTRMQSYPRDGYLGLTDVNPNHVMSPGYHHYQDDLVMMDRIVRRVPGVTGAAVTVDGLTAHVRLNVATPSQPEADRIQTEAYRRLIQQLPRYNMEVTTVTAK